ncbi:MAG: Ribonuclease D [bacterium ADurb.Bin363]|nr:MAG: Ribonuclease D [bacterium ADurb.Bin363]
MMNTGYIKDQTTLEKICVYLSGCTYIAIDTEFIRERYYYSRLGIIQVASEEVCTIIDAQEVKDLSCFFDLLINPSITKVFHSCKEDVSIFYSLFQKVPGPIFDTQIAAALTGYEEQMSYGKLVKSITGVNLGKNETYTNWLQRPLTDKQIQYALDDVHYLPDVYFHLVKLLKEMGRYEWALEEFERLEEEENYHPKEIESQFKMLNSNNIRGKTRNILIALLIWREEKARHFDRIRKDIVKDEALITIARKCPSSLQELKLIPGLFPKFIKQYGEELLEVIKKGKQQKKSIKIPQKIREIPEGATSLLTAFIKKKASEENIAQGIIARKDDIEKFISHYLYGTKSDTTLMKGWRKEFIAKELEQIINGEVAIKFSPGNKQISLLRIRE